MVLNDRNSVSVLIDKYLSSISSYRYLVSILKEYQGIECYIAGGALRSLLSGKVIKDIDFFVKFQDNSYDKFSFIEKRISEAGYLDFGQYGSPRWYPFEEKDIYYDVVPFSNFNVGFGNPIDIIDLLSQFDFTANAIGYEIFSGRLYDPLCGIRDLEKKIIKAVRLDFPEGLISSKVPISRLSVLWFRYMHYASKLSFDFEEGTLVWMKDNLWRMEDFERFEEYFFKPNMNKLLSL